MYPLQYILMTTTFIIVVNLAFTDAVVLEQIQLNKIKVLLYVYRVGLLLCLLNLTYTHRNKDTYYSVVSVHAEMEMCLLVLFVPIYETPIMLTGPFHNK